MKCFPTLQELQVFSVILVDYTSVQVKIGQTVSTVVTMETRKRDQTLELSFCENH